MSSPSIVLSNGRKMPQVGLGTWKITSEQAKNAVKAAIDVGYRHIDTANYYENEKEIGDALKEVLKEGKVKREDLFITTKLNVEYMEREGVLQNFEDSFRDLQLDYIDLYLIHFPLAMKNGNLAPVAVGEDVVDYVDTWKILESFVDQGRVRSIGVSNFNEKQIGRILKIAKHKPVVNQIEVHPFFPRIKLIDACKALGVAITAYSAFGSLDRLWAKEGDANLLGDKTIVSVAEAHNKSPAQVLMRFAIERGLIVIPKSTNPKRLKDNLEVFHFKLSSNEMQAIFSLDRNWSIFQNSWKLVKDHPHAPFNEELNL